jgi:hypothetical protein
VKKRGGADLIIIAAIVVIGAGWFVLKPMFSRDKKRAQESVQTTENLVSSLDARAASAAASVTAIGTANGLAPESPAKDFIGREIPATLAKLPSPDPKALLEAEKRRSAVMEGRLEEANKLYERESKRAAQLQAERDEALAAKREADQALVEAAAFKAGAEQQRNILILGIGALGVLVAFLWFGGIRPGALANMARDIRAGTPPLQAMDTYTTPFMQKLVRKRVKFGTEPTG